MNQKNLSAAPPISDQVKAQSRTARKLRRELEVFHVQQNANIDDLWKHLNSEDRWLRFAARCAIENQDVSQWRIRALAESQPTAAIDGLIALCRQGDSTDRDGVLGALNRIDLKKLKQSQLLGLLRAYQLCFIRLGRPDTTQATAVNQRLSSLYPHPTSSVNHLLGELLVYLQDTDIVAKSISLLSDTSTQEEQIRAARTLTFAKQGWNEDRQRHFLKWLGHARTFSGGKQITERIRDIRTDFIAILSEQERQIFSKEIAALDKPLVELETVPARPVVQEWTFSDLEPHLTSVTSNRSYKSARQALLAANCLKCHRIGSTGAQIGPDLTNVGKRFDARAILESIIAPSKVMDPKYLYTVYVLTNGKVVTGRPVGVSRTTITVETDPLKQTTVPVLRKDIEEAVLSKTSPMPANLINVLTQEEILDLLAYLKSGGNPEATAFQSQK